MYSSTDRERLFDQIISFIQESSEFEGLLQIGSGAVGFTDIYSDIDLMAGCYDADCVKTASQQLQNFFIELGACHIEKRIWTSTVWGLSAYFENGLSTDISFMPTPELPIRSPQHRLVFAKTDRFKDMVNEGTKRFAVCSKNCGLDDSLHYRFINELRYVEIALLRGQFIFADIALNNARQMLLKLEAASEGKKLHQFKMYNTLSSAFLDRLEETYPQNRNDNEMNAANKKLLELYLETVKKCNFLTFDNTLLKLLGCFEQ